jgi:hypothetical protein
MAAVKTVQVSAEKAPMHPRWCMLLKSLSASAVFRVHR